ncbi:MAG TPA: UvrB/UvrC motif-containing protein [Planctomycetota bacterium]|nr:UvrB/UvrC motif-containing protein [Planctomycetota bacterium]
MAVGPSAEFERLRGQGSQTAAELRFEEAAEFRDQVGRLEQLELSYPCRPSSIGSQSRRTPRHPVRVVLSAALGMGSSSHACRSVIGHGIGRNPRGAGPARVWTRARRVRP